MSCRIPPPPRRFRAPSVRRPRARCAPRKLHLQENGILIPIEIFFESPHRSPSPAHTVPEIIVVRKWMASTDGTMGHKRKHISCILPPQALWAFLTMTASQSPNQAVPKSFEVLRSYHHFFNSLNHFTHQLALTRRCPPTTRNTPPTNSAVPGHDRLISKGRANIPGDFLYRINHPLGEHRISQGKTILARLRKSPSTSPPTPRR